MPRARTILDRFTYGDRLPGAVGLILTITVAASIVAALGSRHVAPLFELAALQPDDVFRGEVWRLFTWAFVELSPLRLLLSCLFLYWFAPDLCGEWGARRFLIVYAGIVIFAATGTCLVALVDAPVRAHSFVGNSAVSAALAVAWGLWFPNRVVRFFFFLSLSGYVFAWLTVGVTVLYAIYSGWAESLPALCAEAGMLGWLFRRSVMGKWSSLRRTAGHVSRDRERAKKRRASAAHLRLIERHDDDPEPLSPEMEGKIDRLLGRKPPPPSKLN